MERAGSVLGQRHQSHQLASSSRPPPPATLPRHVGVPGLRSAKARRAGGLECGRSARGMDAWEDRSRRRGVARAATMCLFDDDDYDPYALGVEADEDDRVLASLSPELTAPPVSLSFDDDAYNSVPAVAGPRQGRTTGPPGGRRGLPTQTSAADDPATAPVREGVRGALQAAAKVQNVVGEAASFVGEAGLSLSHKAYEAGTTSREGVERLRRQGRAWGWKVVRWARRGTRDALGKLIGEDPQTWEREWESLEGVWPRLRWIWNRPRVEQIRITLTLANFSVRVPALIALVLTQLSFVASTISLPMLAPLVLGVGIALKGIVANARTVLPRAGIILVFLWVVWFVTTALQSTVDLLHRQGAIDNRFANAMHTTLELCAIVAALMVILTLVGFNISGLLLPAFVAAAFACKDILINFVSGFFLFVVQPFKTGDTVAVPFSNPSLTSILQPRQGPSTAAPPKGGWFEGVCDSVDLRYTVIRNGSRKLFMPNYMFLNREFMVTEALPKGRPRPGSQDDRPTSSISDGEEVESPRSIDEVWQETLSGGAFETVPPPRTPLYPVGHDSGAYAAGWGYPGPPMVDTRWRPAVVAEGEAGVPAAAQYDPNITWRVVYPSSSKPRLSNLTPRTAPPTAVQPPPGPPPGVADNVSASTDEEMTYVHANRSAANGGPYAKRTTSGTEAGERQGVEGGGRRRSGGRRSASRNRPDAVLE